MRMINNVGEQNALTTDKSAAVLGIHEFYLFSRIQNGEIKVTRLRSGEIGIPESELERLLGIPGNKIVMPQNQKTSWPDSRLGIEKHRGGLKRNGESVEYSVPNHPGQFTESEINSYRAAFGAIASQLESIIALKKQLDALPTDMKISAPTDHNLAVSTLLKLGRTEIVLCNFGNQIAAVEGFTGGLIHKKTKLEPRILLHTESYPQLIHDFKANASHTLEFMASNLTAKAQKVVWEQFPDHRPSQVIAAISERCRQAVSNEETISRSQTISHAASRGIKI